MKLTVVNKIILGFGLFGCLLLVTSLLSYIGFRDIRYSAMDVVKDKMPIQAQMYKVKTAILELAIISANGFYNDNESTVSDSRGEFARLADQYSDQMSTLDNLLQYSEQSVAAKQASDAYINESLLMFDNLAKRINTEEELAKQTADMLAIADEASALMSDLSYLPNHSAAMQTLMGTGTTIDNKLLTMNTSIGDLGTLVNRGETLNLIDDLSYQVSNIHVDKEYLNRIAQDIDTQGIIEDFNQQFNLLQAGLLGDASLSSLQLQKVAYIEQSLFHREQGVIFLTSALSAINGLYRRINERTLASQHGILDTVQTNTNKNVLVAGLGLLTAILLGIVVTRSIVKPLRKINRGLNLLSQGDLSCKLDQSGGDEFAVLAGKINTLTDSLRELVGNILAQENRLDEVTQVSLALGEQSLALVDEQEQQVKQTSANTKDVQHTSHNNYQNITTVMAELNKVSEQSHEIGQLVKNNRKQVVEQAEQAKKSVQIIHRLEENTHTIGGILDVIKTIAAQTNLLALNAAIEAARAGEYGRGFAVVADEVRTLANRTQNSTAEIEAMISSLQEDAQLSVSAINGVYGQAQDGVLSTEKVSEQVNNISAVIESLSGINQSIVADTKQQDVLLTDVAVSLQRIVALAQSSAQSTKQVNQSTVNIDQEMQSLHQAVERFKLV
jgi:methyl-accepting chemotaxis protein